MLTTPIGRHPAADKPSRPLADICGQHGSSSDGADPGGYGHGVWRLAPLRSADGPGRYAPSMTGGLRVDSIRQAPTVCLVWCDDRDGHPGWPTHHRLLGEVSAGESRLALTRMAPDGEPEPVVSIALHASRTVEFIDLPTAQQFDLLRLLAAALAFAAGVEPADAVPRREP